MGPALIVRKESEEILYDTSKSVYGLVKSGPVEYHGIWRKLHPAGGPSPYYDNIYKFTVENCVNPIVYVTGTCGKPFASKEGTSSVFYFAGPVEGIKVYCFDVMAPIFKGPALKTRDENGGFTFNSLQRPLNIIGTSTPPPPSPPYPNGRVAPFLGGYQVLVLDQPLLPSRAGFRGYFYTVPLNPAKTYAANIPWSRGCWLASQLGRDEVWQTGSQEGCSGDTGSITHSFWTSPETTHGTVHSTTPTGWFSLTVNPRPQCTYIDVSEYPYPFNPQ
ncbi:Hypothetical protein PFL_6271 [Pseudomonas protegens Pf-5]|jgi:hypothetical protein|uniref:Uncharacterized protein n=1 Tax=Pseudomonas fluorescens (strain ATCC BAA-477 / NRRL B-23932 / Pf-5) TaxID=220664 RepID=F9XXC2_PSEF5|nr:Hypothetical protein PFL_6271 [Pseudomonas protegens Pf-5]